jgi:hypothetical protein
MPYRFVRLGPSNEHVYLPVNRGLKPLGITGHGCFRFDTYRAQAVAFRLDPHTFEGCGSTLWALRWDCNGHACCCTTTPWRAGWITSPASSG